MATETVLTDAAIEMFNIHAESEQRKQRKVYTIQIGDDKYKFTEQEQQKVIDLFEQADKDPLGAVVFTKIPKELMRNEKRFSMSYDAKKNLLNTEKHIAGIYDYVEFTEEEKIKQLRKIAADRNASRLPHETKYWVVKNGELVQIERNEMQGAVNVNNLMFGG